MKPRALAAAAVLLLSAAVVCAALSAGATRYLLICSALTTTAAALLWCSRERSGEASAALRWPSLPALLGLYTLIAVPFAWWAHGVTGSADESTYRFQGRVLASGKLTAIAPTRDTVDNSRKNGFFFIHNIMREGRWFGKYPPGWPALLAGGQLLRIDWLLNPLLGVCLLVLVHRIAVFCFSETAARAAVAILVLSPMFVLNSIGYYSHGISAVLLAAATLAALRAIRGRRTPAVAAMAAALGAALLVRPFTAAAFAIILPTAVVWTARRDPARALRWLVVSMGLIGLGGALLMSYHYATAGSYFRTGYSLYRGDSTISEIVASIDGILFNLKNLTARALLKTTVSVAAFPCLALLAATIVAVDRWMETWVLGSLSVVLVAAYTLQTEPSDTMAGERYYFESLFALAILAAAGWDRLTRGFRFPFAAVRAAAALFLIVQLVHHVQFARILHRRLEPFRAVQHAIAASPVDQAVMFLESSGRFPSGDFNPNEADWRRAPLFFLPDPGPAERDFYTCAAGRARWVLCSYGPSGARIGTPQPVLCAPR